MRLHPPRLTQGRPRPQVAVQPRIGRALDDPWRRSGRRPTRHCRGRRRSRRGPRRCPRSRRFPCLSPSTSWSRVLRLPSPSASRSRPLRVPSPSMSGSRALVRSSPSTSRSRRLQARSPSMSRSRRLAIAPPSMSQGRDGRGSLQSRRLLTPLSDCASAARAVLPTPGSGRPPAVEQSNAAAAKQAAVAAVPGRRMARRISGVTAG